MERQVGGEYFHFNVFTFNIIWSAGLGGGLASPRLWTSLLGFIVILLAIFMIFQV